MENESNVEKVYHWFLQSDNGYRYMKYQCPICNIWLDGPVFIEGDGVHFSDAWPVDDLHEINKIIVVWKKRLKDKTEIPLDRLHIHIQMFNVYLVPEWPFVGSVEYFYSGEELIDKKERAEGRYDAVVIQVTPDVERTLKELEKTVLHELIHVAFPNSDERWVENHTKDLLVEYGYLFKAW